MFALNTAPFYFELYVIIIYGKSLSDISGDMYMFYVSFLSEFVKKNLIILGEIRPLDGQTKSLDRVIDRNKILAECYSPTLANATTATKR